MKGVVLAAGKGSRLYPVTKVIPKPLLPIANRMTLAYAFDRMKECGITQICVIVGENEAQMMEALGDGSGWGVELSFARQTEPKGLAHAVSFAEDFVAGDDFMLYLGDAIYSEPFTKQVEKFKQSGCANLNLVKAVEDPRRFGVANVEGDRIVKLVEKPQNPESNLAMAGMYVFGPQIWSVLPDLKPSGRGEYEITDAIQMLVDRDEVVLAGEYKGAWFDTGTLDSFLETTRYLINGGTLIGDKAEVQGEIGENVVVGEGARVSCASLENCVILPGATVTTPGSIRNSVLAGTVNETANIESVVRYDDQTN